VKKNFFSWLLGKKTKPLESQANVSTMPLSDQDIEEAWPKGPHIEPQQLIYACGQSVGKQRDHNEDSVFAFSYAFGSETSTYPIGLFIVADGMGGHQYGEVASATAARTLSGYMLKRFLPTMVNPSLGLDESIQELMRAGINEAQRAVSQAAPGSGTTLTAALVLGQQVTIGHVGDSRAYAIKAYGGGEALTRDHSLVKRLEELGQISSEEAAIHPQRNVLYRALGQGEVLEPDIFTAPFPQNGSLLICSDGLWSVIPESTLFDTVVNADSLHNACQKLITAANEAGGPDNITVLIIQSTP
jgi:PPM family protein phosphatase